MDYKEKLKSIRTRLEEIEKIHSAAEEELSLICESIEAGDTKGNRSRLKQCEHEIEDLEDALEDLEDVLDELEEQIEDEIYELEEQIEDESDNTERVEKTGLDCRRGENKNDGENNARLLELTESLTENSRLQVLLEGISEKLTAALLGIEKLQRIQKRGERRDGFYAGTSGRSEKEREQFRKDREQFKKDIKQFAKDTIQSVRDGVRFSRNKEQFYKDASESGMDEQATQDGIRFTEQGGFGVFTGTGLSRFRVDKDVKFDKTNQNAPTDFNADGFNKDGNGEEFTVCGAESNFSKEGAGGGDFSQASCDDESDKGFADGGGGEAESDGMISKKEILKMFNISYGQLYRWKREGLIPDEWFIKQSVSTGQETFFWREQIIPRIKQILELKDNFSLDTIKEKINSQPKRTDGIDIRAAMLVDEIDPYLLKIYSKTHVKLSYTECAVLYLLSLNKHILDLDSLEGADFSSVQNEDDLYILSMGKEQGFLIGVGLVFGNGITVQKRMNVGEAVSVIIKACGGRENG